MLNNFARVVIASRLNTQSPAMQEWIEKPERYELFCDKNLQLLKMAIYAGHIPEWLSAEDRKRLTAKRRRRIIGESEREGEKGFSGRDSIKIFNDFYSTYGATGKMINMSMLVNFFTKSRKDLGKDLPGGFLDSLLQMYNYSILQEVKEALYYYNEERIAREIQNYIFAINFETGTTARCEFTGETLQITEEFLRGTENKLLGDKASEDERLAFRRDAQREYTSRTLTQELMVESKPVTETGLFKMLHEHYVHHLKARVLDPFLENENFRNAIKDFNKDAFKTYDRKIRDDVTFLMSNLRERYGYTRKGAKEVCIYVIDNELASRFVNS